MVCQSLTEVARSLKFDWNQEQPDLTLIFQEKVFDSRGKLGEDEQAGAEREGLEPWFIRRARFGSEIPLEYAYPAWGEPVNG